MNTAQEIGAILKQKRKDKKKLAQHQLAILAYNEVRYQSLISE